MYKTPYLCDTTCHTINPQSLHNIRAVDKSWMRNFATKSELILRFLIICATA